MEDKLITKELIMLKSKYQIIERIRVQRDLTYRQLAEEIGLTLPTLYNIAMGRTNPHARNQYKIEKWLNGQFLTSKNETVTS